MWSFTKEEELSLEQIKKLKNQWFTMEEAIEELAVNGEKLTESSFRREANEVDTNKEFAQIGKPKVKEKKMGGKGRPKKFYNRAFIEALRSFAIADTYKKFEEVPIDYFRTSDWKKEIKEEFQAILEDYVKGPDNVDFIVEELSRVVGDNIMQKYNGLIGQNKLLIHQNKKLEDTKDYYIAMYRGVEENANVLNDIAMHIKDDINTSSELLSNKESYHFKETLNTRKKLNEIHKLLEEINERSK